MIPVQIRSMQPTIKAGHRLTEREATPSEGAEEASKGDELNLSEGQH